MRKAEHELIMREKKLKIHLLELKIAAQKQKMAQPNQIAVNAVSMDICQPQNSTFQLSQDFEFMEDFNKMKNFL